MLSSLMSACKDCAGALRALVTLARDPNQTDQVFVIDRGLQRTGLANRGAARLRAADPEFDRLARERYQPPLADLDVLMQLPEGSLGGPSRRA
jgi:ubiquinone biosynthesis protein Coq4